MSFDIFLQRFDNGADPEPIRELLRSQTRSFGVFATRSNRG